MKTTGLKKMVKVSVMAASIIAFSSVSIMAAEFVSVVKDGVNLRSGPTTGNEVLFQLPAGYPLKVLARKGKWLKVSDFENDKGWIFNSLVSKTPYVIVKVKECNARKGPGTNYPKVGSLAREVILKKVRRKGEWIKISHPKLTGWVHSKLVWP
jgi:SH3-like domain-containing protein